MKMRILLIFRYIFIDIYFPVFKGNNFLKCPKNEPNLTDLLTHKAQNICFVTHGVYQNITLNPDYLIKGTKKALGTKWQS